MSIGANLILLFCFVFISYDVKKIPNGGANESYFEAV